MALSESTRQSNPRVVTTRGTSNITDNLYDKLDSKWIRYFPKLFVNRITGVSTVIAGPLVFVVTTLTLESIQPGHDRINDTVSRLVWGQLGFLETGCFYLFALVLIALALNLNKLNITERSLKFATLMIYILSAGFVIIAIIPTNAPGEPATLTVFIHRFAAGLICFLFPVICLSIASGSKNNSTSNIIRNFSLTTGGIGIILSIAGILVIVTETPWKGAVERIILANGILWIEVIGIRLMSILLASNPEIKKINVFFENDSYSPTK